MNKIQINIPKDNKEDSKVKYDAEKKTLTFEFNDNDMKEIDKLDKLHQKWFGLNK